MKTLKETKKNPENWDSRQKVKVAENTTKEAMTQYSCHDDQRSNDSVQLPERSRPRAEKAVSWEVILAIYHLPDVPIPSTTLHDTL